MLQATSLLLLLVCSTESAKILGYIPTASYSHQIPFQPLWKELSLRGHQVTVLTTDPINDPKLTNLTEIDLHFTYDIFEKHNMTEVLADDSKGFQEMAKMLMAVMDETYERQLTLPAVRNLIQNEKFDLLISEAQFSTTLGFGWLYQCPIIAVASLDSSLPYHNYIGNPSHPVVNPDNNLPVEDPENLSFKERVISFLFSVGYNLNLKFRFSKKQTQSIQKYFGADFEEFEELHRNVSMLFINTNPIFHNIRPLLPNTITLGGAMHRQAPKKLPKDLQVFLDSAKEGVVYFSLGSNIKGKMLNETTKSAILQAFSELPYKFLIKMDHKFEKLPGNVKVEKWLPQQDILRHPKMKLFITQGGIQSLQESVINGVPMIGIPFFGDQFTNVQKMIKKGYGVKMSRYNITVESLKERIETVLSNPKYREVAKQVGEIILDEPTSSLEKAVWWVEYVLRHKGAKHLQSVAGELPLWKYFMLDVLALVFGVLGIFVYLFSKIFVFLLKLLCWKGKNVVSNTNKKVN